MTPDLQLIDAVTSVDELVAAFVKLCRTGVDVPVGAYVAKDSGSDDAIPYLAQAGLGLPDEAYYREPMHQQTLAAYQQHVGTMLAFLGLDATAAERVVALEKDIAAEH